MTIPKTKTIFIFSVIILILIVGLLTSYITYKKITKSHLTYATLVLNIGDADYLPYPIAYISNAKYMKWRIQQKQIYPLNNKVCQEYNAKKTHKSFTSVCLKLSLIPKNPKKFQSLTMGGYMVTAMHGYDTYKECTTAHNDGTCYRIYILGSNTQADNIIAINKKKYLMPKKANRMTLGMLIMNTADSKTNYLPYPIASIKSDAWMKVIQSQHPNAPLTASSCQEYAMQNHMMPNTHNMQIVCLKESLIPKNPKKFQSLTINGSIVTAMHGYNTYHACTAAHHDGTCYRLYIMNSMAQTQGIIAMYKNKVAEVTDKTLTTVLLIHNVEKSSYLPYPLTFVKSIQWLKLLNKQNYQSLTEAYCEKFNKKDSDNEHTTDCMIVSLIPKHSKKFQFITTKGFMITTTHGYDTYKECTTAHHDKSCYRVYVVDSQPQMMDIIHTYKKKYKAPLDKKSALGEATLIFNAGESSYLPYPTGLITSFKWIQLQTNNGYPLTSSVCKKDNNKHNPITRSHFCLKLSLLPEHPKKFQSFTTKGFMITAMQGYDTYKECTTEHHDKFCYRIHVVDSENKANHILHSYRTQHKKQLAKKSVLGEASLFFNAGESSYLPYPTGMITSFKWIQLKTKYDGYPLTTSFCQKENNMHNPITSSYFCLKLSLLPEHPKKFQSLTTEGFMIIAMHGYDTYKECTTAHHDKSCYRIHVVDSENKANHILNTYRTKHNKQLAKTPNKSWLGKAILFINKGKTVYLPYKTAFATSTKMLQLLIQNDTLFTKYNCQLDHKKFKTLNSSTVCFKLSLLPKHPKKFQFIATKGFMITKMHGYDTYKECTAAHNDGSCYRLHVEDSKLQRLNIMATYKQKYNQ